ncbi:MAG: DNA helicase PcrA [Liquorilactobacillus ghanensis]|uniref:DNA helicase PcrA n=1 Tax=Liquorilactobacillus ghanensis TaxID=399370 RepID=UPI0039EC87D7
MEATELLSGLNDKQQEAVRQTEGPLLVIAGAGSGKTRVLTHRVAYLIEAIGVNPWNILAITFTNKAAREMRERVSQLLGDAAQDVWVSTFHALCVRILRRDIDKLGYQRAFTIVGTSEQRTLMKRVLAELNLDSKKFDPRALLGVVSQAKNQLLTPKEFAKQATSVFDKTAAQAYQLYQQGLEQNQAVDFDDLIMLTLQLFDQEPEILQYYQRKFLYLHVDEYQDTNQAQYELVTKLAAGSHNLCVVGDADQSIYGWRGADMRNILDFEKDYPNARVVKLEQNYRSTKVILQAANDVIKNNINRKAKKLWTENNKGDRIHYYRAQTANDEAYFVIRQIQQLKQQQAFHYSDFAVLYRTNAQSRTIEEAFIKSNIPYRIVGAHKFYDRKEILDVLAYLQLVTNPADSLSFNRIVNEPKRGIGNTSLEKLADLAAQQQISLLEAAQNPTLANISGKAARELVKFATMINQLHQLQQEVNVTELTEAILDHSGYRAALKATRNLENQSRLENLDEFLSVTQQFDQHWQPETEESDQFVDFLADLALMSDQDSLAENSDEVALLTLHAAKGLEFPVVFLVGLEEGIFPLGRASFNENELEEERRLAYVGITRAKKELFLTNALARMLYGRQQTNPVSRFIKEIEPELLVSENQQATATTISSWTQRSHMTNKKNSVSSRKTFANGPRQTAQPVTQGTGAERNSWQIGDKVWHKAWGTGTIVKVNGTGEDLELDIAFTGKGIKRLLAAFAPITKKQD